MPTVLITEANRGVGLGFVQSYASDGWKVHACCRYPDKAKSLAAVKGDISLHKLDVTDNLKVEALARQLADEPIDILLNNAGITGPRSGFGETDYDTWAQVFAVNTMAPLRMTEHFAAHVARSEKKLVANISSRMGSIASVESGGTYLYRSSKCALNMVIRLMSLDLIERGIVTIALHPGWVQTDMGGSSAEITVEESVRGLRAVMKDAGPESSGGFFNYDGTELPW